MHAILNGPAGAPDYSRHPNIRDCSDIASSAHDFAKILETLVRVNYFTNLATLSEEAIRLITERDERLRRQGDKRTIAALARGKAI